MGSAADKAKGLGNEAVGNVKQGIGKATGSRELEAKGKVQEIKGEAQQAKGKAKDAVKRAADL
ncbi:CsbD family protein [Ancylobacter lacus]|uniref:CsbD family protein n=1 Tax=Ancylobacter lacus TaxID=2579970 RepID=UPI001BCF2B75|nr:CsbD family protein [Ancylobacter lacus]MBS7538744.1 CsbD family protein [Ancylobacter lacus]